MDNTDVSAAIFGLLGYAEMKGLLQPPDRVWAFNSILRVLELDAADISSLNDSTYGKWTLCKAVNSAVETYTPHNIRRALAGNRELSKLSPAKMYDAINKANK